VSARRRRGSAAGAARHDPGNRQWFERHGLTLDDDEHSSRCIPPINDAANVRVRTSRTRTPSLIGDQHWAFIIVPKSGHGRFEDQMWLPIDIRPNLEQGFAGRGPQGRRRLAIHARKREHIGIMAVACDVDGKQRAVGDGHGPALRGKTRLGRRPRCCAQIMIADGGWVAGRQQNCRVQGKCLQHGVPAPQRMHGKVLPLPAECAMNMPFIIANLAHALELGRVPRRVADCYGHADPKNPRRRGSGSGNAETGQR